MVVPPNSDKWLLKWYPPIKQPFGVYSSGVDMIKFIPCPDAKVLKKPPVMIQHSHAHLGCSRSLPLALSHLHLEMDPIRDSVNRNHPSQDGTYQLATKQNDTTKQSWTLHKKSQN